VLISARSDVTRNDRDHHTGEYAACHDLEKHVRQAVRGVVGVTEAGVTDGLGEDQRPAEADESCSEGQPGDTCRDGSETGFHV
jgi:hypothetical protein